MRKSKDQDRAYKRAWAARPENKQKKAEYQKQYRIKYPDAVKDYQLRSEYGVSLSEYNKILARQGGKCAFSFCHRRPSGRYFPVDHDHETGQIRGILCDTHNRAIGMFGESHTNISEVVNYLRRTV